MEPYWPKERSGAYDFTDEFWVFVGTIEDNGAIYDIWLNATGEFTAVRPFGHKYKDEAAALAEKYFEAN
jgi:hypothetical protein